VCDVSRVERRREADRDDQQEERKRRERDAIGEQAAPGEAPRTSSRDLLGCLAGRKADVWLGLVGELGRA